MSRKAALITGVTGQDGAYLAEFLLERDYIVHGVKRRASTLNSEPVDHLYRDPHETDTRFFMHYGDLTDATNLIRIIQDVQPTEIYNLAAQRHVQVSFETPEYTANADGLGTLRLLEAIHILGMKDQVRFYQASASELFGSSPPPQNEHTPFHPRSPYAAAKLYAYWITVNYREAYGIHVSNGILFNHEGPTRGETFVTRKITRAVAAKEAGLQKQLHLGNLDAKRDWGHARDYVDGCGASFSITPPTISCWQPASRTLYGNLSSWHSRRLAVPSNGVAKDSARSALRRQRERCVLPLIRATSGHPKCTTSAAIRARPGRCSAGAIASICTRWSTKWSAPTARTS